MTRAQARRDRNELLSRIASALCDMAGLKFESLTRDGPLALILFGIKEQQYGFCVGVMVSGAAGPKPVREATIVFLDRHGFQRQPAAILSYMMARKALRRIAISQAEYEMIVSATERARLKELNAK